MSWETDDQSLLAEDGFVLIGRDAYDRNTCVSCGTSWSNSHYVSDADSTDGGAWTCPELCANTAQGKTANTGRFRRRVSAYLSPSAISNGARDHIPQVLEAVVAGTALAGHAAGRSANLVAGLGAGLVGVVGSCASDAVGRYMDSQEEASAHNQMISNKSHIYHLVRERSRNRR